MYTKKTIIEGDEKTMAHKIMKNHKNPKKMGVYISA